MKLTWFGHSAVRIETGKSVLLIDPFLRHNPTFNGAGLSFDTATAGTTHVALTHGHEDHIGDAVEICKARGATLIACHEIATYLGGKGVEKSQPGNHGGEIFFDDFSIVFTNAWHSSSNMIDGKPLYLGNPAGFVVRPKSGPVVYHMGDTGIHSDMALVEELYQPAVGIVPIGDRYTMGARQAALACRKFFKFKTVIPCHFGTFPVLAPNADQFVAEMKGGGVVVPKPGVAFTV